MTPMLQNTRRHDITFHPSGRIDITARIAKILHLNAGDVIDVGVSGEEYLLYVRLRAAECVGRHEATVHPTNRGKHRANNFRAHSRHLCQAILKASGNALGMKTLRIPAGNPVTHAPNGTAIPLIIRHQL